MDGQKTRLSKPKGGKAWEPQAHQELGRDEAYRLEMLGIRRDVHAFGPGEVQGDEKGNLGQEKLEWEHWEPKWENWVFVVQSRKGRTGGIVVCWSCA